MPNRLVTIEFKGLKEVFAGLERLERTAATRCIQEGLRNGEPILLAAMQGTCPVKTGALRDSIKIRRSGARKGYIRTAVGAWASQAAGRIWQAKGGAGNLWFSLGRGRGKVRVQAVGGYGEVEKGRQWFRWRNLFAAAKVDVFYLRFLEFGTKHIPAGHFLRYAFEEVKYLVRDAIGVAMGHILMDEAAQIGAGQAAAPTAPTAAPAAGEGGGGGGD